MIAEERIAEIKARVEAATDGPWEAKCIQPHMDGRGQYRVGSSAKPGGFQGTVFPRDAEFIAHSREDIPYLLAEVKRLYGKLSDANYDMARSAGEVERVTRERDEARAEAVELERQLVDISRAYKELSGEDSKNWRTIAELSGKNAALTVERDLARPVVHKAQVWRDQFARPTTSTGPRHVALCEAVDTYESEMEAPAGLPGKPEAPAEDLIDASTQPASEE